MSTIEAPERTAAATAQQEHLMCPSAPPEVAGSRVLGVVGGTRETPEIAYLNEFLPVSALVLLLPPSAKPTQVLRFAAPCQETACCHFDGRKCNLVTRIVNTLPAVVDSLPACLIRSTCRWYEQEGRDACYRCPQVVTYVDEPDERLRFAAEGKVTSHQ